MCLGPVTLPHTPPYEYDQLAVSLPLSSMCVLPKAESSAEDFPHNWLHRSSVTNAVSGFITDTLVPARPPCWASQSQVTPVSMWDDILVREQSSLPGC